MKFIDYYLNKITMYKLMAFGLLGLAAIAILFGYTGTLTIGGNNLLASFLIISFACFGTRLLLSWLYRVYMNDESSLITAMILFFIMPPPDTVKQGIVLALVSIIAIASKFIIARRKKHIFNPAAIGATIVGFTGLMYASWWVANGALLPFVLLLGGLVLRKTRRFELFFTFAIIASALTFAIDFSALNEADQLIKNILISSPIIFLGAFMLTEPSTLPPSRRMMLLYGAFVGVLVGTRWHVSNLYITPEIALVAGNLLAYMASSQLRQRHSFQLVNKVQLAPTVFEFTFKSKAPVSYKPGQYMELTLPVTKPDMRGNRRTFTIASSPTEKEIKFTVRCTEPVSSYKKVLQNLNSKTIVYGQQVAGDFTLPNDASQKLLFIAGGIGVTPVRSIIKYLIDTNQARDIVLVYQSKDFVYKDLIAAAKKVGITTHYQSAVLSSESIKALVPDHQNRTVYISGPDAMVRNYKSLFKKMDHASTSIKTDYFTGY